MPVLRCEAGSGWGERPLTGEPDEPYEDRRVAALRLLLSDLDDGEMCALINRAFQGRVHVLPDDVRYATGTTLRAILDETEAVAKYHDGASPLGLHAQRAISPRLQHIHNLTLRLLRSN